MHKRIIPLLLFLLVLTGCSSFKSNYNNLEKDIVNAQMYAKDSVNLEENSFFKFNSIREDQTLEMKDNYYFVFYHKGGKTQEEKNFEDILTKYIENERSFNVYTVDTTKKYNKYKGIKLIFIERKGREYKIIESWEKAEDIDGMPFKKVR